MSDKRRLSKLIEDRLEDLGISRRELVPRLGYTNVNKGHRRLSAILLGDRQIARQLRTALALALEVDISEVDAAIDTDHQAELTELDKQYREKFVAHAIVTTAYSIPSPIFVAAMCRSDRLMRIDFKEGSSPVTYSYQAKQKLPEGIPAFGKTTGFIVNYSPYHAVAFDRCGHPTRQLNEAVRLGQAHLNVSRHVFPPELIQI